MLGAGDASPTAVGRLHQQTRILCGGIKGSLCSPPPLLFRRKS